MVTDLERQAVIALAQRSFETQRLPYALALSAGVDSGERLRESDKRFLHEMLNDVQQNAALLAPEPTLKPLQQCAARLYDDILSRDWRNGTTASPEKGATRSR